MDTLTKARQLAKQVHELQRLVESYDLEGCSYIKASIYFQIEKKLQEIERIKA